MMRLGVFLFRGLGLLVVLLLILGAVGIFYFRRYLPQTVAPRSFPQTEGQIKIEGLQAPVNIYRDKMGVPSIYASSLHDLFFSQGYVHAQDRFWLEYGVRHNGERDDVLLTVSPIGARLPAFTVHAIRGGARVFRAGGITQRIGLAVEKRVQPAADDLVVVDDEHADDLVSVHSRSLLRAP